MLVCGRCVYAEAFVYAGMYMCVCTHVGCMCIWAHAYPHVCSDPRGNMYLWYMCVPVPMCLLVHVCVSACVYGCWRVQVHVCLQVPMCVCVHLCVEHVCIQVHVYVQRCLCKSMCI